MPTPEETAAAETAKAQQEAEAAKIAAEAKSKGAKTETEETPEEEPFDKDRAMATITKLREVEKQQKKDAKELAELKAEAQKRADAELTETERLRKQAEAAAAENAQLKTTIMRQEVIAQTGLPAIFTDRLKGATKEEMLADAQELAQTLPTVKVAPKVSATNPASATQTETEAQMRERIFGRQASIFDAETARAKGGGVFYPEPRT